MRILSHGKKVKGAEKGADREAKQPTQLSRRKWYFLIIFILTLVFYLASEIWGGKKRIHEREARRRLSNTFRVQTPEPTQETPLAEVIQEQVGQRDENWVKTDGQDKEEDTEGLGEGDRDEWGKEEEEDKGKWDTQGDRSEDNDEWSKADRGQVVDDKPGTDQNLLEHNDPPICESLKSTSAMKGFWHRITNGDEPPPPFLPRCSRTPITPRLRNEHMSETHPLTSVAKEAGFLKQDITIDTVRALRRSGMIEQLYLDEELKFVYCAVPKSGCTGMKAWMLNNAGKYTGGTVHGRDLYRGPRLFNAQFLSNEKLLDVLSSGEYFKFTTVRNPYTRVLATYIERFQQCEQQRSVGECRSWKSTLVNYRGPLPGEDVSFEQVLGLMKKYPSTQIDFKNAHWLPAVSVCGLDVLKYDWVGMLEDENDAKALYDLTGTQPLPARYQRGVKHSVGTGSKMDLYTEAAKNLVFELYNSTDLALLGYSKNDIWGQGAQEAQEAQEVGRGEGARGEWGQEAKERDERVHQQVGSTDTSVDLGREKTDGQGTENNVRPEQDYSDPGELV